MAIQRSPSSASLEAEDQHGDASGANVSDSLLPWSPSGDISEDQHGDISGFDSVLILVGYVVI